MIRAAAWHSTQGVITYGKQLREGDVIAIDYAPMRHKPWVVYAVKQDDDGERTRLILRPLGDEFDFARFNEAVSMARWASVRVLPEHYSVCVRCGELPPCSEVWAERVTDAAVERAERFEVAAVCPSCQEPVTSRQGAHRFEENLYVPLGPPVTFHSRRKCAMGAVDYDMDVAKATDREPRLTCGGLLIGHLDGARTCTNITCPGVTGIRHRTYTLCSHTAGGRCNRTECWVAA